MANDVPSPSSLIATLGSEPQVVTLTLDLLLARDPALSQVIVVHTAAAQEPIQAALRALSQEWGTHSAYEALSFRRVEIRSSTGPVADVDTEEGAAAVFRAVYQTVAEVKRQGHRLHLSISGGRKTMAVYGMAVAQLLFDQGDCLWHLLSTGALLLERRMHADTGDDARLVHIPVLRWSDMPPGVTDLIHLDDPFEALRRQEEMQAQASHRQQAAFVNQVLTPAEREAAACLVREGWTNQQIGEHLNKSERTIAHQLSLVYDKARSYFGLNEASRHTLIMLLGEYFRGR